MGALGCGDAPHGSRWRCRCGEQEEAPRLRREAAYIPLDLTGCPQQSGPGSTGRANSRRRAVLVMPPTMSGTLGVHRTSWRIPFPRRAGGAFLVLGFRGAWVPHAPPRVPKQHRS